MKFGIIAEGWSDVAVLENILLGKGLIVKSSDVLPLRPERMTDETDMSTKKPEAFSNWSLVKQECQDRIKISYFLGDRNIVENDRKLIIHIDTAECGEQGFEVERPAKGTDYCLTLREKTIDKISKWLDNQFLDDTYFAIAIEETEAWIHALYENKDTSKSANPKEAFQKFLSKKGIKTPTNDTYKRAKILADNFTKLNKRKIKDCLDNNPSLKMFVESLPAVN
ncbi:MAG: hypothetical protein H6577_13940 [Lewinellaceae bacterium]|nr:hypothetical protein [Saprospiraceae bacterium]MCB9339228.1 hypothetical protein [Lewinellaceae bacterium]